MSSLDSQPTLAQLQQRIRELKAKIEGFQRRANPGRALTVLRLALSLVRVELRETEEPSLFWTLGTESKKNPHKLAGVPIAYLGSTAETARNSCAGCQWLDNGCYAHAGRPNAVLGKIAKGNAGDTLKNVLTRAPKGVKAVRVSAIGDVGGRVTVSRAELFADLQTARSGGLSVLGYTHFWRDPINADLRPELMASVEASNGRTELEAADEALDLDWRPAAVLSHQTTRPLIDPATGKPKLGSAVVTPKGRKLLVCPWYTRGTHCNDCRLCDPKGLAWGTGKYDGVAFVEHVKGRTLPKAR